MTAPKLTHSHQRAQILLYRALIDAGHHHDVASSIAVEVNPDSLIDDAGIDTAAVAAAARLFPAHLDQSPGAVGERYLTALSLVESIVTGDRSALSLLPAGPPETQAVVMAHVAVTKMVLDSWVTTEPKDVLDQLRAQLLAAMVDREDGAR